MKLLAGPKTKKPSIKLGFGTNTHASAYPATQGSGRRAREVIPEAIRAELA